MQVLRIYLIYQITIRMRLFRELCAKKNGGGGVINTSSHEIDLIASFFGLPTNIYSSNIRSQNIKCETEDLVNCNLLFKHEQYFTVNLELFYSLFEREIIFYFF